MASYLTETNAGDPAPVKFLQDNSHVKTLFTPAPITDKLAAAATEVSSRVHPTPLNRGNG